MAKFLTVKEAARAMGKSTSSIRRMIYPILEDDKHPDRSQIEPDVQQAKALRVKGENFAWKINEKLLRREFPEGASKGSSNSKTGGPRRDDGAAAIIDMLRRELEIKNQQLATQNELMKGLSERLREGNILMGSLQQQLSLSDGSTRNKNDVVNSDATTQKPEKGTEDSAEKPRKTHWLFRNRKLF